MEYWIEFQTEKFYSLKGYKVIHWDCIEMALREDLIEWYNSKIPYLQCMRIDILLDNQDIESLVTYQDADEWGFTFTINQQRSIIKMNQIASSDRVI